jgi:hypothetical protein
MARVRLEIERGGIIRQTPEQDRPVRQPRPVRYWYPSRTLFGQLFKSVAHWAIAVGDPRCQYGVVVFELLRAGNKIIYHITRPPFSTVDVRHQVIGYTDMSDAEIEQYGEPMPFSFDSNLTTKSMLQPPN